MPSLVYKTWENVRRWQMVSILNIDPTTCFVTQQPISKWNHNDCSGQGIVVAISDRFLSHFYVCQVLSKVPTKKGSQQNNSDLEAASHPCCTSQTVIKNYFTYTSFSVFIFESMILDWRVPCFQIQIFICTIYIYLTLIELKLLY